MYRDMARLIMYGKGSDFSILKNHRKTGSWIRSGNQRESGAEGV